MTDAVHLPDTARGDAPRDAVRVAADPRGVERAYTQWHGPLLRFLHRRLGNHGDAEDVAQESFVRLMAATSAPAPEKQGPYIYRIAVNLMRDEWRRRTAAGAPVAMISLDEQALDPAALAGADDGDGLPVIVERRQRLARLEAALAELPARQREAFVLYRFDGLTQVQVAERMGISRRMAVKHLGRALAYCELRVHCATAAQAKQLARLGAGDDVDEEDAR